MRDTTIRLTEKDKTKLKKLWIAKGCTARNPEDILIKASLYLLESYLDKQIEYSGYISKIILETWKTSGLIKVEKEDLYQDFLKRKFNTIQKTEVIELIKAGVIVFRSISNSSLRRCVGSLDANRVERDAVISFSHVLGLENISLLEAFQFERELEKQEKFYKILSQSNYKNSVKEIAKISAYPNRIQIYRMSSCCNIHRMWLIRRIEWEVKIRSQIDKVIVINDIFGNDLSAEFNSHYLQNKLKEKTKTDKLNSALENNNIVMIVNIEKCRYAPDDLQTIIIQEFWEQLQASLNPQKKLPGFCLIFLMDGGSYFSSLENHELLQLIPDLPINPVFDRTDFEEIAGELASAFQDSNTWDSSVVDTLYNQSENGNPKATLEAFQKRLNLRYGNANQWPNYP